ncbi:MAG TPA: diaminopimelate epimerase [Dehalococcoidia bacterium]|nr:diaminopimelate epimerase [Dehalococcoidia bacterium]
MRFTKYHGAGNDFIIIDARALERPWSELSQSMCIRHFGVGADGIILVAAGERRLKMRMFNPDGSEAEACGNGLRCFVKYVLDEGIVHDDEFTVDTVGGPRRVLAFRGADGTVSEVELCMGTPRLAPEEIPAVAPGRTAPVLDLPLEVGGQLLALTLVSMGNPHAVAFTGEDPARFPLTTIGPLVEQHEMFPARTNFEVVRMQQTGDADARVWERGVGETLACGSGACAIAVAARLHGYCGNELRVHLPGGTLTISWSGDKEEVRLRGPVKRVFAGDWPD